VDRQRLAGDIGFHVFAKVPINNCAMRLPPILSMILQPIARPRDAVGDFACSQLSTIDVTTCDHQTPDVTHKDAHAVGSIIRM
jgi:hypothetical protein